MKRENEGPFRQTFSFDHCSGKFLREESTRAPLFDSARRFSCVFLSTSAKDAARLNHYLSAAGIRAYHASDTTEAEVLFAITRAKILLVDIDRMFEGSQEILQRLDESHPDVSKVFLTAQNRNAWPFILSHVAFVPKPANLGELLDALEYAHPTERRSITRKMRAPKRFVSWR